MDYSEKYQKIANKLVKKNFTNLKEKIPKVFEFKIFSTYGFYMPILNIIGINRKCRYFSKIEIKGILIHELCHAEYSNKIGFLKNFCIFIVYWISPKFRKDIEIKADKLVIERGYSKELFALTKKFESEFGKMRYGFSQKQIKSYAKKLVKKKL